MKDPTAFRQRVAAYRLGKLPYLAGRPITDDEYFDTMEKVAIENNAEWNRLRREEGLREMSVDEEIMRVLNDHTYDYRGYYNKYPQNSANAKTHWTDEFKTYLHPTFSDLSRYAPNNPNYVGKTQFNPYEIEGGRWINNETEFVPSKDMLDLKKRLLIPTYLDGKTPKTDTYDPYVLNKVFHNMNVPTGQCAEWANKVMDNLGYNTYGDAWLLHGNVLFNGYSNVEFPQEFDEKIYDQYSTQAADNLLKNFNSDALLDKAMHYIVNMYYPESPNKQMAAKNGNGFYGTHTGVLFYDKDGKWKVAHNMGNGVSEKNKGAGKIWVEDFKQMLSKTSHHRPTAIITPNKHGSLSKARRAIRNIFGFADGKSPYDDDRVYTTSDYMLPELVITPTKDSPEELAVEQAYLDRFKNRRLEIPVDNTAAQERWFRLGVLQQRDAVHNSPWMWGLRGLAAAPAAVMAPLADKAMQTVVANPYVNAALDAYFGASGILSIANELADWTTALEVAPMFRLVKPIWNAGKDGLLYATKAADNIASATPEVTYFYHGSPVRFDKFSADFIGSGEGGSKVMRGINLWPKEKIANAPKFANIKSPDAPLHLGVSNTPLGGELNPTVYDVSGRGLKLYTASPREIKSLSQSDLISQGYDGIQTPNQVTVFPESIERLSIDKQSTIEEFIHAHPEVKRWTPWTTDNQKMQNIIDMSKMSKWTPAQWTAAQDAAIARGDMVEAQRLRDLHFSMTSTATPGTYYRGTKTLRNFYRDKHVDPDVGEMNGIYFSKNPKYAGTYGNVEKFYLYSTNPLSTEGSWTGVIDDATRSSIEKAGYDAIINNRFDTGFFNRLFKNSRDETITFNGSNMKLTDAVTYDDAGNIIPLSKRDNFNINDIRYGLLPWILSTGTVYGVTNHKKIQKQRFD